MVIKSKRKYCKSTLISATKKLLATCLTKKIFNMALTLTSYQRIFSATSNFKQAAANYNQEITHPLLQALLNIVLGQISTGVEIAVDWYHSYQSEQEFIQQAGQIFYSLREAVTTGIAVISIPRSPAITLTQNGNTTTLTMNGQSVVIEKTIEEIYTNLSSEVMASKESWASNIRPLLLTTEFQDDLLNNPAHFGGSFSQMKNHNFIRRSPELTSNTLQMEIEETEETEFIYSYSEDVELIIKLKNVHDNVSLSNNCNDNQTVRPISGFDRDGVKKVRAKKYSPSKDTAVQTAPFVSLLKQATTVIKKPKKMVTISTISEFVDYPSNDPLNTNYTDQDYAVSVETLAKKSVATNMNHKNKPIPLRNQIR